MNQQLSGVYTAKRKNGTVYYRASLTYRNKHISLGSFVSDIDANRAYLFPSSFRQMGVPS